MPWTSPFWFIIFVFSFFTPFFGDMCRDEDLFAVHVQTWSEFSWWLQNVGAWLFVVALVVLQSGLLLELIWDRETGQLFLICLHESCCCQLF